jgi:hypothetical protein
VRRHNKLRRLRQKRHAGGAQKYRVTVRHTGKGESLRIDSEQARLRRCQKRVHAWAEALPVPKTRKVTRRGYTVDTGPVMKMITLTYADADGWNPNDIRGFMKTVRRELGSNLLAYAWVAETQERGTPHYHVLLYVKRNAKIPEPDTAGWWTHGYTRIETARKPHYILKYTGKEYQKEGLPAGARMFAVWLSKEAVDADGRFAFRLSAVPAWLHGALHEAREHCGAQVTWKRKEGGGWIIRDTGEVLYSPWIVESIEPIDYIEALE